MKRTLTIIISFVLIIAVAIGIVYLTRDEEAEEIPVAELDHSQIVIPSASDMQEIIPDMTIEDIEDTVNTELTEEQLKKAKELEESLNIVDVYKYIDDEDPDDNIYTYIGVDGEVHKIAVDPELINKSDEEARAEANAILEYHKGIVDGTIDIDDVIDNSQVVTGESDNIIQDTSSDSIDYNQPLDEGDYSGDTIPDYLLNNPNHDSSRDYCDSQPLPEGSTQPDDCSPGDDVAGIVGP